MITYPCWDASSTMLVKGARVVRNVRHECRGSTYRTPTVSSVLAIWLGTETGHQQSGTDLVLSEFTGLSTRRATRNSGFMFVHTLFYSSC